MTGERLRPERGAKSPRAEKRRRVALSRVGRLPGERPTALCFPLMSSTPEPGTIAWQDLTVDNAEQLRDFYAAVVGWTATPVHMGGYSDFTMNADGEPVAGVCHARGGNADLPAQWLLYVTVDDLEHSIRECLRLGGHVVAPARGMGGGRFCVIQDPAGAVCALYQPPDAA